MGRRSQRVGTALLKAAFQQLIQKGHNSVYLWVVENNSRVICFYLRHGGIITDKADKDLFGHAIRSAKIVWSDIDSICKMS
jgi:GNAT superfamily N-acetyltransferase